MKCISCEVEINPKWKHAIDINICPFCGQSIMEDNLKSLLIVLSQTLKELQNYPEQLDDWMLSNYNYIKIDSPDLVNYLPSETFRDLKKAEDEKEFQERKRYTVKVKTEKGEEEVEAERIQSEEKTNEFFQRAEAVKPKLDGFKNARQKTEHLKELAQKIKRAGTTSVEIEDDGEVVEGDPLSYEEAEELETAFNGGGISSSLDNLDDDVPEFVLNMSKAKANGKKGSADLLRLQKMHDRLQNSRRNFESGESKESGGFSRS